MVNIFCSPAQEALCFQAKQSPHHKNTVAVVLSNHQLQVWDCRLGQVSLVLFHGCDVTTLEWHLGDENLIMTGAADGLLRLWDLRKPQTPLKRFIGNLMAIRKVVSCKFHYETFLSCSYDKTIRCWNLNNEKCHRKLEHHTEFVYGLDTSPKLSRMAVDCSWDSQIKLFTY